MIRKFRKDPFYLARYHTRYAAGLFIANILLVYLRTPSWTEALLYLPGLLLLSSTKIQLVVASLFYFVGVSLFSEQFQLAYLLAAPVAIMLAFSFSGLIHCASHGSIRPRWLNRPVGELMGLFQLSGFADWKIIHVIHHTHTDDPELDPHPPLHKGYWEFTKGMRQSIGNAFMKYYFRYFEKNETSMRAVRRFTLASRLGHLNKIAFWFLVLQPQLFTFLFATSIVTKMFQMSLVNWAAHRPSENGDGFEIRNLEHSWYRVANFFSFGLYIHKNHHLSPSTFNPKNMRPQRVSTAKKFKNVA